MKLLGMGQSFAQDALTARALKDNGTAILLQYPDDFWDVTTLLMQEPPRPVAAVAMLVNHHVVELPLTCQNVEQAHRLVLDLIRDIAA